MFNFQKVWIILLLSHLVVLIKIHQTHATVAALKVGSFNCSQPPKFENIDINKCCRLPVINLGGAVEKCHKQIESLKTHNYKYPVYAHVCYPECIYRETGTLREGDFHMETVKKFLEGNVEQSDKIIVPTIVQSFETCLTNIKQNMQAKGIANYPKFANMGCSPYASMVYGCVNAETFLHCPPEMWRQEEHSCNLAKSFALQCNLLPHVPMPTF